MWDLGETGGTVALRMPNDEIALALLAEVGPMAVSSANRTGYPASRTVVEAASQLGAAVEFLTDRIPPGSLDAVHLFFPDPWPKHRHHQRRFVSRHTLDLLATRLTPGGHVLVATDWADYAEHVEAVVAEHGAFTARRVARPSWRPTAGFEAKGIAAGRAITDLLVERATRVSVSGRGSSPER